MLAVLLAAAAALTCYFALMPGNLGGVGGSFWHAAAFATLGFLSRLVFSRTSIIALLFALTAFGGAIEVAQGLMALQRAMQFGDVVVDVVASAFGLAVGAIVLAIYRRLRDSAGTEPVE